jgi:hypothetical protein
MMTQFNQGFTLSQATQRKRMNMIATLPLNDTDILIADSPITLDAILTLPFLSSEIVELGDDQEIILSSMIQASLYPRSSEAWHACASLAPDLATFFCA